MSLLKFLGLVASGNRLRLGVQIQEPKPRIRRQAQRLRNSKAGGSGQEPRPRSVKSKLRKQDPIYPVVVGATLEQCGCEGILFTGPHLEGVPLSQAADRLCKSGEGNSQSRSEQDNGSAVFK